MCMLLARSSCVFFEFLHHVVPHVWVFVYVLMILCSLCVCFNLLVVGDLFVLQLVINIYNLKYV